jgi:hypothetical protein
MIYVNISGYLGNQMFQYAVARALSIRFGHRFSMCLQRLREYGSMHIPLMDFKLCDDVKFDFYRKTPWFADPYFPTTRIMNKFLPKEYFKLVSKKGIFFWQGRQYMPIPDVGRENYYLTGWWQSDKYFAGIRDILLEDFIPKYPPIQANTDLYEVINNTNSICISVRRSDYVTNPYFVTCGEDYVRNAVKIMNEHVDNPTYIIFSDDVEWCKQNLSIDQPVYFESGLDPVWEKMRLMYSCKHFIITNSSFSWWAQYLGRYEGKIVVAPERWYSSGDVPGIYQDNWILADI